MSVQDDELGRPGTRPGGRGPLLRVIVASVAVVVAVAAGALALSGQFGRASSGHAGSAGSSLPPAETDTAVLDRIAAAAPCARVQGDTAPARVAAFPTVAVVSCESGFRIYPGEGEWQTLVRRVTGSGLGALVTALTRPDERRRSGEYACPAIAYGPLQILLADGQGHYLHPRAPVTYCDAPQPAVFLAIRQLPLRTVSVTRVVQERSAASVSSGCDMQWKNELALAGTAGPHPGPGGPVFVQRPTSRLYACLYRTAPGDAEAGLFVRGVPLSAARSLTLRAALTGAGPRGTSAAQSAFAVVRADGQWVNVELGGCWRVLRDDRNPASLGTADAAVVSQLLGPV